LENPKKSTRGKNSKSPCQPANTNPHATPTCPQPRSYALLDIVHHTFQATITRRKAQAVVLGDAAAGGNWQVMEVAT